MAIAFVQAGTGSAITGASGSVSLNGATAGNLIVLHIYNDGDGWPTLSAITNINAIDGSTNSMTAGPGGGTYQVGSTLVGIHGLYFGRAASGGTCSLTLTADVGGFDLFSRFYEFSGVSASTVLQDGVLENADDPTDIVQTSNTSTIVVQPDCLPVGSNRLAVVFVAVNANQAMTDFTGETGGDFTQPVAAFSSGAGTAGSIGIQTAAMPIAQLVTGGQFTITSNAWGAGSFALIPSSATAPGDDPPIGILGRGAGW